MRLGILGGTFNPIHFGHLRVAEEIGEHLALKTVYLIPSGIPPHKSPVNIADFSHRIQMVRKAITASPLLNVWDIEGKKSGPSYSIETLQGFHARFGPGLKLFFIIGMDAFSEIEIWKDYKNLFGYTSFVVINRKDLEKNEFIDFIHSLNVGLRWSPERKCFDHPSGNVLLKMNTTLMDISASRIRKLVAQRRSIRFLVPEIVREYIEKEGLYLTDESA